MGFFETIVLAIVQGLTEFLPVSSSGHLTFVPILAGWPSFGLAFDVALHLGTLIATVVYFREDLARLLGALFSKDPARARDKRLAWMIALATAISAAMAFALEPVVENIDGAEPFALARWVGFFLLVTTALLLGSEFVSRRRRARGDASVATCEDLTWGKAALIGVAQGLAPFPGVSRSGSTIAAGLTTGLEREESARFSFLLSVPIIFAAVMKKLIIDVLIADQSAPILAEVGLFPVLAGVVVTGVIGYLAIKWMLPFVRKHSLAWFAGYTAIVGTALIVWSFF